MFNLWSLSGSTVIFVVAHKPWDGVAWEESERGALWGSLVQPPPLPETDYRGAELSVWRYAMRLYTVNVCAQSLTAALHFFCVTHLSLYVCSTQGPV